MEKRPLFALLLVCALTLFISACDKEKEEEATSIETFLENSQSHLDKGQYNAAMIEARNAIQAAPEDIRGKVALARIFTEVGQPREAANLLEKSPSKD
ncbi:MAG: hypothetical protein KDI19_08160, partial [Pseudomonadales bacterium]|nr:hypothetical protein [Pseudomonadales bacterium]